jgi:potassium-transporting ATPase KdpC subunit
MRLVVQSVMMLMIMTVMLGFIYPLAMTGIGQIAFKEMANGSLVLKNSKPAGSMLIGQNFVSAKYFHGRPSSGNYNALLSGGSNFGPTNKKLIDRAAGLAAAVRKDNGMPDNAAVPSEMALASGSGLDPHISLGSALLQIPRIAAERNIKKDEIIRIVRSLSEKQYWIAGYDFVNVFKLNIALDELGKNGRTK